MREEGRQSTECFPNSTVLSSCDMLFNWSIAVSPPECRVLWDNAFFLRYFAYRASCSWAIRSFSEWLAPESYIEILWRSDMDREMMGSSQS